MLAPHKSVVSHQVIKSRPYRVYFLAFRCRIIVQLLQKLWRPWIWQVSWKQAVDLVACRVWGLVVTADQSKVLSAQPNECLNFLCKILSHIVLTLKMICGFSTLDDFSCQRDSHRVANQYDFFRFCVLKNCLYEFSEVKDNFFGMVIFLTFSGIHLTPSHRIEFRLVPTVLGKICR